MTTEVGAARPGGNARILICDDHALVREGVRGTVGRIPGFEVVAEARDGSEGVEMAGRLKPDLVLMDLKMPQIDGVSATRRIKELWPATRVLVLTTYGRESDVLPALRAGADGFLLKDASPEELREALQTVLRGETFLAAAAQSSVTNHLRGGPEGPLSEREVEVMQHVALGLTNKEVAEELHLSTKTVKRHVERVTAKLGVGNRTHAVSKLAAMGLIDLGRLV